MVITILHDKVSLFLYTNKKRIIIIYPFASIKYNQVMILRLYLIEVTPVLPSLMRFVIATT